jgi:hypothetical protein
LEKLYKDPAIKAILIFIKPILKQTYLLNLYFQNDQVDFYRAFNDINTFIWSLARQILKLPLIEQLHQNLELLQNALKYDSNFSPLDVADLGFELGNYFSHLNLPQETVKSIQSECIQFIKTLLNELLKRMPSHLEVFKQASYFSPAVILNHIRPRFSELPLQFADSESISDIESQYRNELR